jgi:hypothetical protein
MDKNQIVENSQLDQTWVEALLALKRRPVKQSSNELNQCSLPLVPATALHHIFFITLIDN